MFISTRLYLISHFFQTPHLLTFQLLDKDLSNLSHQFNEISTGAERFSLFDNRTLRFLSPADFDWSKYVNSVASNAIIKLVMAKRRSEWVEKVKTHQEIEKYHLN